MEMFLAEVLRYAPCSVALRAEGKMQTAEVRGGFVVFAEYAEQTPPRTSAVKINGLLKLKVSWNIKI